MSSVPLPEYRSPYWPTLGGPVLIFLLGLFLFARPLLLLGDGGTCRHFTTGIYIISHLAVPTTTYTSAVEPGSPWVTHELLCDLLFGIPFPYLGLNWVVLTSALAISLALTWSYQIARIRGAGLLTTLVTLIIVIETCTVHWSARPHVFTYLLFIACYFETFVAARTIKARAIILSIIMVIWSNLHGSFPLGILMVAARCFGDFVGSLYHKTRSTFEQDSTVAKPQVDEWGRRQSLILLICTIIASCLNIRGATFLQYVIGYLTSPKIQAHSDEWRSIDFSFAAPVWSFLALSMMLIFVWVYSKTKPRLGEFCYMIFLFCASLYAMRLIPYFALASVVAMSAQFGELRLRNSLLGMPIIGKIINADNRASESELSLSRQRWLFIALAALLSLCFLLLPTTRVNDFDPDRMPVKAVDYLRDHKIDGLGFVKDNWGAYVNWRLNQAIFIDDKTDFYSQTLVDDYTTIFMTTPGWEEVLSKYHFNYVLIPKGLPLEFMLSQKQEWNKVYEDPVAVLFIKKGN